MRSLCAIVLILLSCHSMSETYKVSDHYDGKTFHNPGQNDLKSFWQVLKWKMTNARVEWPETVPTKNYPLRPLATNEKINATFVNHATFLIQLPGLNILTDPLFSERTSPFTFMGPMRVRPPGIPLEMLPKIDVVLISHNHYDHLDLEAIKQIDGKFHPLFLVALGDEKLLLENGIQNVKAMDWWEEVKVKDVRMTFAPSQHWSARWLWDKNKSLWGSFMIDNGRVKTYFAGDTGYGAHFLDIKSRLGAPDLALLPIGAYKPQWFMRFHHMNPEDAVKAHIDLGATRSIGMHFGTFQLADEGFDEPVRDLNIAREKLNIPESKFSVLEEGQALSF